MDIEKIRFNNLDYALIIRKGFKATETTFFTESNEPMQLGVIKHKAGYIETPHTHRRIEVKAEIQQMLYITSGKLAVDFFDDSGSKIGEVTLTVGDTILLMYGGHAIRVIEDVECLSVKQGPYVGIEKDKINLPGEATIDGR
jgi:hypothetical protein